MGITLYIGEKGLDWSNAVEPQDWERASRVATWLVREMLERYDKVDVVRRGVYGWTVECYDDESKGPDVELEEALKEMISETLELFIENQSFWLRVPIPWRPYALYAYEPFLRRERDGDIRVVEPRDNEARRGLYALTDLSEESWVGEVAEVFPEVFPNVRVGDYAVCDGIGAPVRLYRAP